MKLSTRKLIQRLTNDTTALALPRGRRVGQPGHELALEYLRKRIDELELLPFFGNDFALCYERPYPGTGKTQRFTNLIAVIPGQDRSLDPILLGAHYDSVIDAPCADDNATSVALTLAVAEEFLGSGLQRDLIIAFFDAEEPPHFLGETMGSTRFYEDYCEDIDFAAVIVSDLIGHDLTLADLGVKFPKADILLPNVRKTVFVLGSESDPVFPGIVESSAGETKGIKVFPTLNSYIGNLSDHHAFERDGQPFLFLSCAQGRYYHHERDNLDWINFKKLASVTEFVSRLIRRIDETPANADSELHDPIEFELRMIKKAAGPALPLVLKSFGIEMPKTRQELDTLLINLRAI